jgi:hypothetical protein
MFSLTVENFQLSVDARGSCTEATRVGSTVREELYVEVTHIRLFTDELTLLKLRETRGDPLFCTVREQLGLRGSEETTHV